LRRFKFNIDKFNGKVECDHLDEEKFNCPKIEKWWRQPIILRYIFSDWMFQPYCILAVANTAYFGSFI